MKRFTLASGLFGALLLACGCGSSKQPEVPSWFKDGGKKDGKEVVGKNTPESLQRELKAKIEQLTKKQKALDEAIASTKNSRLKIVKQLKADPFKVKEAKDLEKEEFKDNPDFQRLKTALQKNLQEQKKYEQMKKEYASAQFEGEEALDRLDRALRLAKAGISDKEMEELAVTIAKIDNRLKATDPNETVELIKGSTELDKALKPAD